MKRKSPIDLHNSSGRQKNSTHDLVDRISALPDTILGLILSLLPTENVVATTVLSKRRKFVWMTVHNLDFFHDTCMKKEEADYIKFVQFVNRILLLPDAGSLNKFHLVCEHCCISPEARSWISKAITRNVRELSVSAQFYLPIRVFSCNSLRSLELKGRIYVPAVFEVFLPRLESIKLVKVDFQSEEAFDKLISGCPVLKSMYLGDHYDDKSFTFIISSTSLKRLDLCINRCNLKLNVPSLEYLRVTGWLSEIYVQKNLTCLVEAEFRISRHADCSSNSIVEAVRAFDCVKALYLSADVMLALGRATLSLSIEFKRLVKLETLTDSCDNIPLQDFIQNTDNLEVLTIDQSFEKSEIDDHSKWASLVQVPRCLSNSLKKIVIVGYDYGEEEYELIRYMLKHGSVLQVMEICCYGVSGEKAQLGWAKEICKFPKKSPTCEVSFVAYITEQWQGALKYIPKQADNTD